ncbi:hypothetical protein [Streptomyces sp. NPDC020330]|uniref:hypothetical protein n=1 Tax=unclassified Streptomyces TaxID=2593676 RepID=UPI0037AFB46B
MVGKTRWFVNIPLSFVVGDVREASEGVKGLSIWNWPPFVVMAGLAGVAAYLYPGGPQSQFLWAYFAFALAAGLAILRILGIPAVGEHRTGAVSGWRRLRPLISLLSVAFALAAVVRIDYLADHGEVEATGRVEVSPRDGRDGKEFTVNLKDLPPRERLRISLTISDARPATQSCAPDSTLDIVLADDASTLDKKVPSGRPVEFQINDRKQVAILATLTAPEGCLMSISTAEATLHG